MLGHNMDLYREIATKIIEPGLSKYEAIATENIFISKYRWTNQ